MTELLTIEELANYLKISKMTIYRLIKQNKIPVLSVGNQWRFNKDNIDLWLEINKKEQNGLNEEIFELEHPFIQKYKNRFRCFFQKEFSVRKPDIIVLLDRKGAKIIEELGILPKEFNNNIFYPDMFKWLSDEISKKELTGKRVAIIDEMVQYGSSSSEQRSFFEEKGALVNTYALVRRKTCYESGKLKDIHLKACLDLDDSAFMRFTAEMTKFFSSQGQTLDVDHILLSVKPDHEIEDVDGLIEFFSSIGKLYILPSSQNEKDQTILTIDDPIFCLPSIDDSSVKLQTEGVCKLRVYIHQNSKQIYFLPVVFPEIHINPVDFMEKNRIHDSLLSEFCSSQLIRDFDKLTKKTQTEFLCRAILLYLSFHLVDSFIKFFNAKYQAFKIESRNISINKDEFVRNYGKNLGAYYHKLICDNIKKACEMPNPILIQSIEMKTTLNRHIDNDYDFETTCKPIIDLLYMVKKNAKSGFDKIRNGLSFTEIKQKLPGISASNISMALDILLDKGIFKPFNDVCLNNTGVNITHHYLYLRKYRKGEYDDPPTNDSPMEKSIAKTDENYATEQMVFIIPYILDYLMRKVSLCEKGVNPTLLNNVLINFYLDWRNTDFSPIFLNCKPSYLEPIIGIPKKCDPFNGDYSLDDFSKVYGSFVWNNEDKCFTPNYQCNWKSGLNEFLVPAEEDFLAGLLEVYISFIDPVSDLKGDVLSVLTFCRNEQMDYASCYQNILLWSIAVKNMLIVLKLYLPSLNMEKASDHLENINNISKLLRRKMDAFLHLKETKTSLEESLINHPRTGPARAIIESIDIPDSISDQFKKLESALKMIMSFNSMLDKLFTVLQLPETEKNCKDFNDYLETHITPMFADKIKKIVLNYIDIIKQTAQTKVFTYNTCESIRYVYKVIENRLFGSCKILTEPEYYGKEKSMNYLKFYQAKSKINISQEIAFAYMDITGYMALSEGLNNIIDKKCVEFYLGSREIGKKMAENVDEIIRYVISEKDYYDHYTTDSWIFVFPNADDLLDMMKKIIESADKQNIFLKCVCNWGNAMISKGLPYGDPYIDAYRICEESKEYLGGNIIITDAYKERIKNTDLLSAIHNSKDILIGKNKSIKCYEVEWRRE